MPGKDAANPNKLTLPDWVEVCGSVSHETLQKCEIYQSLLQKWQKTINLVGPSTLAESGIRHFADSLQILPLIPKDARTLYDLGSGAGFPGLVLAIARPDLSVHLVESDQRKATFLRSVSRETFTPVIIHNERVENVDIAGAVPDVVTARALADLETLLTLTQNWRKENPNMVFIFPKGERAEGELATAQRFFSFEVEKIPSRTGSNATVLVLKNVKDSCE
jgi:16S rRNA (guanine527-N7)-methyltransferase